MEEQAAQKKDPVIQIMPARIKTEGVISTRWTANAQPGTTRENILKPEYWAHFASRFKHGDEVVVRGDDFSFWAEYLVVDCDRTWAKVKELRWVTLTFDKGEVPEDEFEYKWRGPTAMHSILRKSDGQVMVEKLNSKDAALEWLANHKKSIAA